MTFVVFLSVGLLTALGLAQENSFLTGRVCCM